MTRVRSKAGFDARALRTTSTAESFPWLSKLVTLVRVAQDGVVSQAKTEAEKRAMLIAASERDLLLAAWPGEWSQDVFVVDDLAAARLAIGLPRRPTAPRAADVPPARAAGSESVDRPAYIAPGRLWQHLADLTALPVEGQRQLAARFADRGPEDATVALFRSPQLDPQVRQHLIDGVSPWLVAAVVNDEGCTTPEALRLLERFPTRADVLDATLRRPDTRGAAEQVIAGLTYMEAARLWLDSSPVGSSSPRPRHELAWAVLQVVLTTDPPTPPANTGYASDRYQRSSLVRSLVDQLPTGRRDDVLRDPKHGRLVQRALLAGTDLTDNDLVACLPEVLDPSGPVPAAGNPALLQYVERFPRLVDLADARLGQAAAGLLTAGWSPVQAARAGHWGALVTAARIAEDPKLIDALVHAAVFDNTALPTQATATPRWRDPRRYELVDLLTGNTLAADDQIRHLLGRLTPDHVEELQESAPRRSKLNRLCDQELQKRRLAQTEPTQPERQQPAPELPTDQQLSTMADPQAVLRDLLRDRSQHRLTSVNHALTSTYMTDDLAWRLPVQDLERHPVYGPRLATKVAKICGNSPARWQAFTQNWAQPNQLLATTLFKRLEEADPNG